ncbi:MAG: outer membrane lipoprotein LolB [Burkholderiales bacterium]|nr:outer membrane lipoprotein LolB [Burkholderiales bacterium]
MTRTAAKPLRAFGGALALLALASCATIAPRLSSPSATATVSAFEAAGRLSARRGNEGGAVHFTWAHAPDGDRLDVATPLGQVIARLRGDATGVRVERPGEASAAYADWNAMTRDVIGVAIPVEGLATWIQAAPIALVGFGVERDASGRVQVLRQRGWEIVYAYPDASAMRPSRLVMRYPDSEAIEVRIVVDRFEAGSAKS